MRRIPMQDRVGLQKSLESTLFDVEEAFSRKLKRYVKYWLEEPEDGRRYAGRKYVGHDDHNTAFRHIDISIPRYLESGRGKNMIQGSVSLDDETAEDGCTILVRCFYKNIAEWWGRVVVQELQTDRPLQASGFVHIVDKLYTVEDVASFGDFEPVPCLRGQVRITKPEIVHSSPVFIGQRVHRTILPWYVGVQNLEKGTLDVEESDDWDSLCLSHMHQTAPENSPSGHPNNMGNWSSDSLFNAAPCLLPGGPSSGVSPPILRMSS
ncbi:hypothetical protein MMC07_002303 [Pseudocyphellaria aurata]|nr:hypothetical protein [Pseudocyphellaria aurata]